MPEPAQRKFFRSLLLLILLNLVVKPVWIFLIDRSVQNATGFSAYGQYFSLLNLCLVFNFMLDMGVSSYVNREVASGDSNSVVLFSKALRLKGLLGILFTLIVFMVAWMTGVRNGTLLLILVVLQGGSSLLLFIRACLTAAQLYQQDATLSVIDKIFVILAIGFLFLYPGHFGAVTINRFAMLQLAGILIAVIVGFFFLYQRIPSFQLMPFQGFQKRLLLAGLPFAINVFLMTVISRADGFLLERLHENGAAEAGIYAAGFRLLDAFNMVGFLVAGFLLPYIARHWPKVEQIIPVLYACRHLLMLGSVWVATFALAAPGYICELLYGDQGASLVFVLSVVLLALPSLSLLQVFGTVLTATGKIKTFLRISFVFAVLSVLLNILFIPAYGAIASAVIAVIVQGLYAIATIYFTKRKTGFVLPAREWPTYFAAAVVSFAAIRTAVYFGLNIPLAASLAAIFIVLLFYYKSGISFRQLQQVLLEK